MVIDRSADEPDLGALVARLLPHLIALEEPILGRAGLSMWEYAIITELASGEVVSQAELSQRTRRDPTRLGRHLTELDSRGLITRTRAGDQRQLTVALTPTGQDTFGRVKQEIRAAEDALLHPIVGEAGARELRALLARILLTSPGP
ncbi:MarR family winged helix-turn-helix transcriptional regulator [Granulicoccus phenolivorans]|uniref:MarR family winged helix-turn-helix transcriptional regulator n=1 Tax=Granulicoccus phenolivorans TaxID=266854 RepID=UPI000407FA1C|nr:MarR family transcriptional regulator [Granulicoccus phenolivorans]